MGDALVYFGSGAFGLPTLRRLVESHDVALVVTQPDRGAGRSRRLKPTPVAAFAEAEGLDVRGPDRVNEPTVVEEIRGLGADAYVVIAYGQKLGPDLLRDVFAINLHGSLLPKYRGAAPINWAVINGETETGVSVIAVAARMDAGDVYASVPIAIDPAGTAGELHDRLAALGPDVVLRTLRDREAGTLAPVVQDERLVTHAPKLAKADGTVRFDQPAGHVRRRIHGLTPWPGCTVRLGSARLKLLRVDVVETAGVAATPGEVQPDGTVACAPGAIRLLRVLPPGGREMTFEAYRHGHGVAAGTRSEAL